MIHRVPTDPATWQATGALTSDGRAPILINPATGLECCVDPVDGRLKSPFVYETHARRRIEAAAPQMLAALKLIAGIGEGSTTANSLPHIAKIAREAAAIAEGEAS